MQRLLLVNLTRDPDEVYIGFEPQVFADAARGHGLIVIGYLHDGRVDIYHQPAVTLDPRDYDIVGKGLREMAARPMSGARFDITPTGVDVDIAFDDLGGRPIRLRIHEAGGRRTNPFAMLAPMGNTVERPPALPLFFLYDFYFVRRAGTDLLISVDGRAHQPDSIPMILDGARVYFLRYTAAPFLVHWNAARDEALTPITAGEAGESGPVAYEWIMEGERPALAGMSVADDRHQVQILYDPPFPDIVGLAGGMAREGELVVDAGAGGTITGSYRVERTGDRIDITVRPRRWRPGRAPWGARMIFTIVPLFRKWPETYVWRGQVDLSGERPRLRSAWERSAAAGQGAVKLFG